MNQGKLSFNVLFKSKINWLNQLLNNYNPESKRFNVVSVIHCVFLECCNTEKCLTTNIFHVYLMRGLQKNEIKNQDGSLRWSTSSVLRWTWTGWINLKTCLGYSINYLSIWHFMHHPWFQFSPCIVFNNWNWKQKNVGFEAFLDALKVKCLHS